MFDLKKNSEVIVDYNNSDDYRVIDHFEESSNYEGFATLRKIDHKTDKFYIHGLTVGISLDNLIAINKFTNEYEYIRG